jgi:hypothetical protein
MSGRPTRLVGVRRKGEGGEGIRDAGDDGFDEWARASSDDSPDRRFRRPATDFVHGSDGRAARVRFAGRRKDCPVAVLDDEE